MIFWCIVLHLYVRRDRMSSSLSWAWSPTVGRLLGVFLWNWLCLSEDPGSDHDSDPGDHGGSGSGPDDSHRDGNSAGGPAEAHPAAGGDSSHVASDPDSSSTQPRAAACPIHRRRVPRSAALPAAANHQGSTSPGRNQSKAPRQAQRGEQLIPESSLLMHIPARSRRWSHPLVDGVSSLLCCVKCVWNDHEGRGSLQILPRQDRRAFNMMVLDARVA